MWNRVTKRICGTRPRLRLHSQTQLAVSRGIGVSVTVVSGSVLGLRVHRAPAAPRRHAFADGYLYTSSDGPYPRRRRHLRGPQRCPHRSLLLHLRGGPRGHRFQEG